MTITLEQGPYFTFIIRNQVGRTRLIQHDRDFPKVAATFGWRHPRRESAGAIWDAYDFLDQHVGIVADDPGYF